MIFALIITIRKGNVFTSVCHSVQGGRGACVAEETATATEGTHHTGMHSSFACYLLFEIAHGVFSIIVLHWHRRCVTDCFLPSATVGYVFTGVCLFTGGGVHPLQGVDTSPTWADTSPTWADTPWQKPPSPSDGHCSGRYASYWNTFLLLLKSHWSVADPGFS